MSIMRVNPTRMELTNLKKRLIVAKRGHKLLKDKQDELMRNFLDIIKETKKLRKSVENSIKEANKHFVIANSIMQEEVLRTSMLLPKKRIKLKVSYKNIMNIKVPEFTCYNEATDKEESFEENFEEDKDMLSYGYTFTSGELDKSISMLSTTFKSMIELAQKEKVIMILATDIEKTRRRVNALEHIMIPNIEDTIRSISMKLDENERSNTVRLMKIKDMMVEKRINNKYE